MASREINVVMDKEKIPHLVFYCLGFGIISYFYGIKTASVLVLIILTVWAYTYLIAEIFLTAKNKRAKENTTGKKIVVSTLACIFLTVLGTFLFTKLIWGYVAALTAIVFIPVILYQLKNQKS
jgi:uncharacterized membrane protein